MYTDTQINDYLKNFLCSAILLGSANLPFARILTTNELPLDFNAAEGKCYHRLFPGCEELDNIENHGIELLNKLFDNKNNMEYSFAPLSGTQANQIVYNAILNDGDTVLALSVQSGGHSSYIDFVKKYYNLVEYSYSEKDFDINYRQIDSLCQKYKPRLIIAGTSTFPGNIRFDKLHDICQKYNVMLLGDISHTALYIMCKKHTNAFEYCDFVTFTTHKTTRGPRGAILAYKKEFSKKIEHSIFPLSQGAPIFSLIVNKVIMLEELCKIDINSYCNDILSLSKKFINFMTNKGYHFWTGDTDNHLCILRTPLSIQNYDVMKLMQNNNIWINECCFDEYGATQGIRFGFMMLSTLKICEKDFFEISNIIHMILQNPEENYKEKITKIMLPYYKKVYSSIENKRILKIINNLTGDII